LASAWVCADCSCQRSRFASLSFGKVLEGQEIVDTIKQGDAINSIKIEGDTAAVLAAKADRVADWNKILDENKRP